MAEVAVAALPPCLLLPTAAPIRTLCGNIATLIDRKRALELRLNFNFLPHKPHLSAPLFYLPHSLSGRAYLPLKLWHGQQPARLQPPCPVPTLSCPYTVPRCAV